MRALQTFARESEARTLSEAMYGEGIDTTVTSTREGAYQLWVIEDDRLEDARALLAIYEENPADRRFGTAAELGKRKRRGAAKRDRVVDQRVSAAKNDIERSASIGAVTAFLVLAIAGVQFLSMNEKFDAVARVLAFVDFERPIHTGFEAIARGQFWRLVTPIALTPGVLSAVADAFWIFYLAGAFERTHKSRYLILFVIAAAAVTNVVEVSTFHAYGVHGMAGVYHALFAYLFVRARTDARFPSVVAGSLVFFLVLYDVIAVTQIGGPILEELLTMANDGVRSPQLAIELAQAMIGARLSGLAFGAVAALIGTAIGKR